MADSYKWGKDWKFYLDDAAASITDLTAHTNNVSLRTPVDILDITSGGVTGPEIQHGIANGNMVVTCFNNSTTEAIFGPLHNRTGSSKTAYYYNGIKYYGGEFYPSNVEQSGDAKSLIMCSCDLSIHGTVTRTSVAPS